MDKIIEINNLTKNYKELRALDNLSFDVYQGEILGLLGPNGSGKSTTINCLLSLITHDEGSIKILGEKMTPTSYGLKAQIGVVFQDVAVFNELTVRQNIDFFCGLYINDKKLRQQYVNEALEIVSLNEFKNFYPKKLSGGLLRRLNIACGIAHKPNIIILDEPTVAVDPQSRNSILESIKLLNKKGATIIYTSHYMEEVEQLCTRIIIIDKGKIIASGTKDALKNSVNIGEKIIIEKNNGQEIDLTEISSLPGVKDVSLDGSNILIELQKNSLDLNIIFDYLKNKNIRYDSLSIEKPTLNDVFLNLTGKELRD